MGVSRNSWPRHPPEGRPVCTALNSLTSPPPISKMTLRNVVPRGTSIKPVRLTLPTRLKVLVPLELSVPYWEYHAGPLRRMLGRVPRVSTLLIIVGLPQSPDNAGKGGRVRGMPLLPSMLPIRAVSSPHTKAPAP